MIKIFFTACIGILLTALPVHAVAPVPTDRVWMTPPDATVGTPIELHALVYNDTAEQASVTVTFSENENIIATAPVITVPANSATVATAAWVMPSETQVITATVATARTKAKRDIASLTGTLGTVTIGGSPALSIPQTGSLRAFFSRTVATLEEFRLEQLERFTALKKRHESVLGTTTLKDVGTLLQPDTTETIESEPAEKESIDMVGYAHLAYASLGKAFFSHKAFYYAAIILVALVAIRFLINRFF